MSHVARKWLCSQNVTQLLFNLTLQAVKKGNLISQYTYFSTETELFNNILKKTVFVYRKNVNALTIFFFLNAPTVITQYVRTIGINATGTGSNYHFH